MGLSVMSKVYRAVYECQSATCTEISNPALAKVVFFSKVVFPLQV